MPKAKLLPKILVVLMVLATLFSTMSFAASAATASSGTSTRTITVVTKGNYWIPGSESITLSQSKGLCRVKTWSLFKGFYTKETKSYAVWKISYCSTDNKHKGTETLKGSSVKINLKPDKTYKITVSWDSTATNLKTMGYGNFVTLPTWKVKSTYKVSSYY